MNKLLPELIPSSLWGVNPRTALGQAKWDTIRKAVYRRAGFRCEICGGVGDRWPVEAHERYEYDFSTCTQTITGFIAVCPPCHSVIHFGRTNWIAQQTENPAVSGKAMAHVRQVNGWINEADGSPGKEELAAFRAIRLDYMRKQAAGKWKTDWSRVDSLLADLKAVEVRL